VSHLVNVFAVGTVAGGTGGAGPTAVPWELEGLDAGHTLIAGVRGTPGPRLVEPCTQTGRERDTKRDKRDRQTSSEMDGERSRETGRQDR